MVVADRLRTLIGMARKRDRSYANRKPTTMTDTPFGFGPEEWLDTDETPVVAESELEQETRITEQGLLNIAETAMSRAFAPYSGYPVGAALETNKGVFTGCNVEASGRSTSVHAEMLAFFKAVEAGATQFQRIAVKVDDPVNEWPCGLCQHTMAQFTHDIEIIEDTPDGPEGRMLSELIGDAYRPRSHVIDDEN